MNTTTSASTIATTIPSKPLSAVTDTAAQALHLDDEQPGKAINAADGVWVIATKHRPGFNRHMFEINNRTVVFRAARPEPGAAGAAGGQRQRPGPGGERGSPDRTRDRAAREVRRVAGRRPSPDAGPLARGVPRGPDPGAADPHPPHRTTGRKLMKLPRVVKMDLTTPLPQFRGELDAVLFHGLVGGATTSAPARAAATASSGSSAQ